MNTNDATPPSEPNPYEAPRATDASVARWSEVIERMALWLALIPVVLGAAGVAFGVVGHQFGLFTLGNLSHQPDGDQILRGLVVASVAAVVVGLGAGWAWIRSIRRVGRQSP